MRAHVSVGVGWSRLIRRSEWTQRHGAVLPACPAGFYHLRERRLEYTPAGVINLCFALLQKGTCADFSGTLEVLDIIQSGNAEVQASQCAQRRAWSVFSISRSHTHHTKTCMCINIHTSLQPSCIHLCLNYFVELVSLFHVGGVWPIMHVCMDC